jgi:putative sterol carrier protein
MAVVDKVGTRLAVANLRNGISLSALADSLGLKAAQEFLSRIDDSQRDGTMILGTTVRNARAGFSKAKAACPAQVVVPGRSGSRREGPINPSDGLVIIKMDDLAAVVRAGRGEFDWTEAFAPRRGLEAATTSPMLKRGSRGRRQPQA